MVEKVIEEVVKDTLDEISNIRKVKFTRSLAQAITDPNGVGMLNLMLENVCVNGDGIGSNVKTIFYDMPENALCIDGGGNAGYFTDVVLFCGGRSIIYEPNPTALKWLRRKYKKNKKVEINDTAILDKETEVIFYKEEGNPLDIGGNIISSDYVKSLPVKSESYLVKTIRLSDKIFSLKEDVYLLKLDIEGCEFDVIKDLILTEAYKRCKYIVFEEHTHFLPEYKEKFEEIKELIKSKNITNIDASWN